MVNFDVGDCEEDAISIKAAKHEMKRCSLATLSALHARHVQLKLKTGSASVVISTPRPMLRTGALHQLSIFLDCSLGMCYSSAWT